MSFIQRWRVEILAGLPGGFLLALSFPPFATRVLSLVALVPLLGYFIAGRSGKNPITIKRAVITGFIFGLSFFLTLLFWIANLIPESSASMPWIMVPALIILVLYLSCYTALFSFILSLLVRRFGAVSLFAAPGLWSLVELARSRGELGFPWGVVSNSIAIYPVAIQGVSLYGPFGLSFFIVLVNVLVTLAVFKGSLKWRFFSVAGAAIIIVVHLAWGANVIDRIDRQLAAADTEADVAVVQPNLDLGIKWKRAFRDTVFSQIERMTFEAAARGAELVIFPETAAPISISHDHLYQQRLEFMAEKASVDLLTGYVDHVREGDGLSVYNAAGLFSSQGRHIATYEKVNLLPFGEKMPWSQYLPVLSKLDFGQANFKAGEDQTLFVSSKGKFGVLICFESIFSDFTRGYVRAGADFLVNITNDGWFGSRSGPMQHAELAVFRAIENRVTLLRAANTGISMIVDPAGRIRERIDLDVEGIILVPIYVIEEQAFFTRHGHLPFLLLALVSVVVVPLGMFVKRGGKDFGNPGRISGREDSGTARTRTKWRSKST